MCPIEHATSGTVPRFRALQFFYDLAKIFFNPREPSCLLCIWMSTARTPPAPQPHNCVPFAGVKPPAFFCPEFADSAVCPQ